MFKTLEQYVCYPFFQHKLSFFLTFETLTIYSPVLKTVVQSEIKVFGYIFK